MHPDKRRAGRAIRKQRRAARVTTEPVDWSLMFRAFGMLVDAALEFDEPQEGWLIFSGEQDKRRPEERLFEVAGSEGRES